MAIGDVVNDIDSVNAAATLDFQPAAGVEVLISSWHADSTNALFIFQFTDGSIVSIIAEVSSTKILTFKPPRANPIVVGFVAVKILK